MPLSCVAGSTGGAGEQLQAAAPLVPRSSAGASAGRAGRGCRTQAAPRPAGRVMQGAEAQHELRAVLARYMLRRTKKLIADQVGWVWRSGGGGFWRGCPPSSAELLSLCPCWHPSPARHDPCACLSACPHPVASLSSFRFFLPCRRCPRRWTMRCSASSARCSWRPTSEGSPAGPA